MRKLEAAVHLPGTYSLLSKKCQGKGEGTVILIYLLYESLETKCWFAVWNKKLKFSAKQTLLVTLAAPVPKPRSSFKGTMGDHRGGSLRQHSYYCKRRTWGFSFRWQGEITQTLPSASPASQFVARTSMCEESFWDEWVQIKVLRTSVLLLLCWVPVTSHPQSTSLHHHRHLQQRLLKILSELTLGSLKKH